ncbi:hypothetical protein BB559_000858 [Furculomyces boomerangus]|uniref:DUF3020 domain-containing protein n=2 Tax=Harpellales TaxID=61421 RepID=A0A2T9Z3V2_9FUNG|nr:hypothetical protein BB559_000858 [Furculomyces boomerangus]PVZ98999.1 hypothetical protein BB558_004996 [Smittium angustum]
MINNKQKSITGNKRRRNKKENELDTNNTDGKVSGDNTSNYSEETSGDEYKTNSGNYKRTSAKDTKESTGYEKTKPCTSIRLLMEKIGEGGNSVDMYKTMVDRIRFDNKVRKKRWRQMNQEKNKNNDLRCRVKKRANKLFGIENSTEKELWINTEIEKRKKKRIEKEKKMIESKNSKSVSNNQTYTHNKSDSEYSSYTYYEPGCNKSLSNNNQSQSCSLFKEKLENKTDMNECDIFMRKQNLMTGLPIIAYNDDSVSIVSSETGSRNESICESFETTKQRTCGSNNELEPRKDKFETLLEACNLEKLGLLSKTKETTKLPLNNTYLLRELKKDKIKLNQIKNFDTKDIAVQECNQSIDQIKLPSFRDFVAETFCCKNRNEPNICEKRVQ